MINNKLEIDTLKKLLNKYDKAYYDDNNSEISDDEYDKIKEKYLLLTDQTEYNYVPGNTTTSNKKKHNYPALSLKKIQITDKEKLRQEIEKLLPVIIEPKFDGGTLIIDNEVTTRGNGLEGDIVTKAAKTIKGIDKFLNTKYTFRGEVMIKKSVFKKINEDRIKEGLEPFKNARNAANGMLKNKDLSKINGLCIFMYDILNYDKSVINMLNLIDDNCSYDIHCTPCKRFEDADSAIKYIENFKRDELDYEIDGLVVKSDRNEDMGSTGHHPNNSFAVKFKSEGIWTRLTDIQWEVGRTGKITPVANFEPVDLMGTIVTKASLHNYGIITALGLDKINIKQDGMKFKINTFVKVKKANDIIPQIIEVNHNLEDSDNLTILEEPTACPICNSSKHLKKINEQLFCTNNECKAKIIGSLVHMASRDAFDIKGLSEETAKKIVDKFNIDKPYEIYNITKKDILELEGFSDKSADNLYNAIQKSQIQDFDRYIYGIGIPLVGRFVTKEMAKLYYNESENAFLAFIEDYRNDFKLLKTVNGIGDEIISNLMKYSDLAILFNDYVDVTLKKVSKVKKVDNVLTFVITGEFDMKRDAIKTMIEQAGHKVSGSVSSKTNYLLAAPGEESTSKYKKAIECKTKIINSLDELREIIK